MIAFIDEHRQPHGVEPICKALLIVPSTYHDHVSKRADPRQPSVRGACAQCLVGFGRHRCLDVDRLRLRRLRERRLRKANRGTASQPDGHASFVLDALEQAIRDRQPVRGGGLVHQSDRRNQYLSIIYTERPKEAGVGPSAGSVGDSYDNALAEATNGLY